jgi:hypothetical protein
MLMQFIQRARWPVSTRGMRLRRLRGAARLVMRHVGLAGRCDCVLTRDEWGHEGVLLHIETPQSVPPAERPQLQAYFQRKLFELGELGERGLLRLHVVDGQDQAGVGSSRWGTSARAAWRRCCAAPTRGGASAAAGRPGGATAPAPERAPAPAHRQRLCPAAGLALTELSPLGEA